MTLSSAVALGGLALLLVGLLAYERGGAGSREIALVATLAAAAAAGRVLFVAIPSAQPVTAITIVTGVALGPRAGAAVGAVAALVSNAFLGQGPWTPWQMLTWGLCGAMAGLLAPVLRHPAALVAYGCAWGFLFGAIMNTWQLAAFGPALNLPAFITTEVRGLPFDLAHAVTNVVLLGLAGPALIRLLDRYARRLRIELRGRRRRSACCSWRRRRRSPRRPPRRRPTSTASRTRAAATGSRTARATSTSRAGSCSASRPRVVTRARAPPASPPAAPACAAPPTSSSRCWPSSPPAATPATPAAATWSATSSARRKGGRIGPLVNSTIFGVLALKAARAPIPPAVVRGLVNAQRADGSYGFARGRVAGLQHHGRGGAGAARRRQGPEQPAGAPRARRARPLPHARRRLHAQPRRAGRRAVRGVGGAGAARGGAPGRDAPGPPAGAAGRGRVGRLPAPACASRPCG